MTPTPQPYPAYKLSGVPWLGDVPEHWEVARLKGQVANITDQARERDPGGVYIALEHVESWLQVDSAMRGDEVQL